MDIDPGGIAETSADRAGGDLAPGEGRNGRFKEFIESRGSKTGQWRRTEYRDCQPEPPDIHLNDGEFIVSERTFSKGDAVEWDSHGATAYGKVERKITERTEAGGRTVEASPEEPQYLVRIFAHYNLLYTAATAGERRLGRR